MTIFIAHTNADDDAAESLAKAVERRGLFVEHEGGEIVGRPLQENDALILIWSEATPYDPDRLVMERRALDAWADGRLVLVTLDEYDLPVGLRDLPVIEAHEYARWPAAWEEAMTAVAKIFAPAPPRPAAAPAPMREANRQAPLAPPEPEEAAPAKAGHGGLFVLVGLLAMIGIAVFIYRRLQTEPDLSDFATNPDWPLLGAAGLGLVIAIVVLMIMFGGGKKKRAAPPKAKKLAEEAAPPADPALSAAMFVSYANDDALQVAPVVAAVERAGRQVWIDKSALHGGESWAGESVRAIKSARGVMVLCSPAAFASDHVKREVYLADRYRKPLLPVFLTPADMPEDFEYFFAGVQWLDLSRLPEGERAAAIKRALASV